MRSIFLGLILGLVVLAGIYWKLYGTEDAEALLETAATPVLELPLPTVATDPEPEILHPLPGLEPADESDEPLDSEADVSLPEPEDTDSIVRAEMRELFGAASVESLLVPKDIVRRFVITVDSLDRDPVPLWLRPVRRVPGIFAVEKAVTEPASGGQGDDFRPEQVRLTTSEQNLRRYAPLMKMVDRIDVSAFATVYKRYYPLIQDSYDQIGNPDSRYFNDRFVEIIDHLLETPEVEGAIELAQPKVLYKFADPDLERRSHGQKALLRIGPSNAGKVKEKLRSLRRLITRN